MREDIIRIVLVDDHELIREGIRRNMEGEEGISVVAEAGSPEEAHGAITGTEPDLVILDISLGTGRDGIELIRECKGLVPGIKILILSMHDETIYVERAVRAGADGYVTKKESSDIIIEAVRAICKGESYFSPSIAHKFINRFVKTPGEGDDSDLPELTSREKEIFIMIGMGNPTSEIAQELNVSVNTVESHRRHIKEKLGLKSASDLLKTAIKYIIDKEKKDR